MRAVAIRGAWLNVLVLGMASLMVMGCQERNAGEGDRQAAVNEDRQTATDAGMQPPDDPGTQPAAPGERETTPASPGAEQRPIAPREPREQQPATPREQPPGTPGEQQPSAPHEPQSPAGSEQPTSGDAQGTAEVLREAPPQTQPVGDFRYVGVTACAPCHRGASKGAIHESWLATPHAKAFENLGAEDQNNPVCLPCHTTGHGRPLAANVTPQRMVNVQCEACHGPGSEYKALAVMRDRQEALRKGLILPTREVCLGCHGGPFPAGHPPVAAFNFESALPQVAHSSDPIRP